MGSLLDFRERLNDSVASLVAQMHVGHVLLTVLVLLLVHIAYLTCLHPLRSVPGPPLAKVTVLWKVFRYARGQWHTDIANLHRQYGRVVRIAPNEVSFVDKDALIKIYGHASGTRKTSWYHVWTQPRASTGFFSATDPREHAFLRKRVSAAYSMSTISSLESEIDNVGRLAFRRLDDMATKRKIVNLQHWTAYFAFDVVCALGIGGPLGFLEQGVDVKGIIKSIHDLFFMSSIYGDIPGQMVWLRNPITQALSRLAGHTSSSAGRDFATWLFSQVQDRMQTPNDPERHPDMLDHFISMKEADGRSVNFPGVVVEAGNLIGAGADTTSAGISSILGELVRHPEDYKVVQREVDEVYARGDLQAHGTIDYKTAEKLPWLSACVKEALRLTPSIVWQLPRHVPEQGITIDGHYIPASAVVSLSPYAANRDEIVFGNDASEWNPGRYIAGNKGVTDEYVRNIERFNTTFCYRYNMTPVNAAAPYRTISQWFVVNKDFNVVLERRQSIKE